MNTTKLGTEFENKVFDYFSALLDNDDIAGASKKHSKIQKHPKYKTSTGRIIDCDISIESYNPSCKQKWSSLIIIECKRYTSKVDIADLDEFQNKIRLISSSGVKGILVSTVGFSKNFIKQAKEAHVGLLILSEIEEKWYACRNLAYKQENLMSILCGETKIGSFPVAYNNGGFTDICGLLKDFGVDYSNKRIIDIPFLKMSDIENIANSLYLKNKYSTNDIAGETLSKEFQDYKIRFEDMTCGILGKLMLSDKQIVLSNEIINDIHRRNFTLAHEIGHLILHRAHLLDKMDELKDYSHQVLPQVPENIIRRIERQANCFASCLLMPKDLVFKKMAPMVVKYRLTKGYLYLDNQACNRRDVNLILSELSLKLNVSKEAIKIRLKELNLLREIDYSPRRIDEII